MGQIVLNYLGIVMIPLILGGFLRFFCRCAKRPYLITLCLTALMAAAWTAQGLIPSHGSEAFALLAVQASCTAAASLLTGGVIRLKEAMDRLSAP